ncbi:helix-turn-helix domain-containing protein [Paenibacillus sp. FSL H3-0333]|uniref:helix-turn-helix domain-containing protein n=1 Tax=Paenibacillus sp. FSL H3-0333 TaxID=2921373 RepID=UPI0030F64B19
MEKIDNQVGELLKELRESKGWTMRQASEKTGVSAAYISMLEKGVHSSTGKPIMITPEILLKFSAAYDYPYHILSMKAGAANYKNGLTTTDDHMEIDHLIPKRVAEEINKYDPNGNQLINLLNLSASENKETLGDRIYQLRLAKDYTKTDLSNLIKPFYNTDTLERESFTIEQIESYENDKVEPPLRFIVALSDLFNVSCDWILKGKDFVIKSDTQNEKEQMLDVISKLKNIVEENYKSDPNS